MSFQRIFPYATSSIKFTLPDLSGVYTIYLKYFSTTGESSNKIVKSIEFTKLSKKEKFIFKKNLKLGNTGIDVKFLQEFLNQSGYLISSSGSGSPGKETSFFGLGTKKALIKFQEDNAELILKPFNLRNGTGLFGAATRNFINKI